MLATPGSDKGVREDLEALREQLPFDPFEFMDWEPPWEYSRVNVVD